MADTLDIKHEFERWMSQRGESAVYIGDGFYSTGSACDQAEAFRAGVEIGRAAALASRPAEVDGWIRVDDRLPAMDESVLVFLPNNGDALVEMDSWGDIYECPVSFSTASVCVGEGWGNNDFDDVSHWRKMPAAPSHTTNKEK